MHKPKDINTRIVQFFLENTRFTLLVLVTLIIFGTASVFFLKTSGFPSPDIKIAVVNTVYPGASASTVLDQVTLPLENVIKEVDGVKSYTSSSRNNFSSVVVTIDEKANAESVKSKIDSSIRSVSLPDTAQTPILVTPQIGAAEYTYVLSRKDGQINREDTYQVFQLLKKKFSTNPEIKKFTIPNEIEKKVGVFVKEKELQMSGLTYADVIAALKSLNLEIPVTQDAPVNGQKYNITLSLKSASLDELQSLRIVSTNPAAPKIPLTLSQVADIEEIYSTDQDIQTYFGNQDHTAAVAGNIFSIDVADSVNLSQFNTKFEDTIASFFDTSSKSFIVRSDNEKILLQKYQIQEVYNTNKDNNDQVHEVIAGFVGEKWDIGELGNAGYIFGGIQLVVIVMLLLVSWRAAFIAATALPLSFFFSTLWVWITGNDLNTLVLFSLVLVVGLVVDPALVVLESIQRNLDKGLKGKEAALASVHEIGSGLALAVLTSVLVFVPFGVVSGIFGQLISYIPLTIIPALIGSYVVPLIFLTWIGSKTLKRSKNKSDDEIENLWGISKSMIHINRAILHSGVLARVFLVLIAITVPLGIAGYYFSSGKVKPVQFAQPEDGNLLLVETVNFPQKSLLTLEDDNKELIAEIIKNENITSVAPYSGNGTTDIGYLVALKPKKERNGVTASKVNEDLKNVLAEKFNNRFFFSTSTVLGPGTRNSSFPISIAIKTSDLPTQRAAITDLTGILGKICEDSNKNIVYNDSCSKTLIDKVDNGYDGREVKYINVNLLRDQLTLNPVNPILLRETLASAFKINNGEKVAVLPTEEGDLEIVLEKESNGPSTLEEIKALLVRTIDGRSITLDSIAAVEEVVSPGSIQRVKGETVGVVKAKPIDSRNDQTNASKIQSLAIEQFKKLYANTYSEDLIVEPYSEGDVASISKSFQELGLAFILSVILTYIVLVVFFNSFSQPLVILFSIPLTFIGIFPALSAFVQGQFGFLEIIGVIILVGLVENVAIFLIDAANQKIKEGYDPKDAIAIASGLRLRPILLTKITTLVSTAPLAILSEFYRSISVVIIFGLLTSGLVSLFITPTLFIFFRWVSEKARGVNTIRK